MLWVELGVLVDQQGGGVGFGAGGVVGVVELAIQFLDALADGVEALDQAHVAAEFVEVEAGRKEFRVGLGKG
jgi:hypothetical protein